MTFLSAVILLGALIFVHELGHFIFAKLIGVRVLKFSLGFGPRLWGFKRGDTEYAISAVPLGGYVKMLGENGEEEINEGNKAFAFSSQPVRKRALIVLAGPVFNLLFAFALFVGIFASGVPALYPDVGKVMDDSPAKAAGLMKGDRIAEIDGKAVARWEQMTDIIHSSPGKRLSFKIKRGEEMVSVDITPRKQDIKNIFMESKEVGLIGIQPLGTQFTVRHGLLDSVALGASRTVEISVLTVVSIVKLIQRIIPADTIGGPILIVQMAGEQAAQGALSFFSFMALISINLGVLNLLPIPVLDGGHLMFFAIEALRGKPVSERAVHLANRIGIAALIALMTFAIYNDIMRFLFGKALP